MASPAAAPLVRWRAARMRSGRMRTRTRDGYIVTSLIACSTTSRTLLDTLSSLGSQSALA